ncbi:MW1434 family type I TA system toxin [Staphylococcus aureus]|uniref:Thoeris anti-defense Tad2 family protein n=1 Tax=Staphylococcus aureus TaxID=1280 RepID=UPI0004476936|nr:MW1434 family type I TA system toxin [Staphylococcus aureus]EGQ0540415.1 DUF2829 domain-containing protein [Staphylococcus aureus]EZY65401.1 hypothetical protein V061_00009 [Staphylococcus aureus R0353]EZY66194.1 hypothetical protein V060_00009 [Staphylococcus aureus R0294]EZY68652.1 hypothetical protein V064_02608 [Staphylococcus aureus R0545]EZY68719.1 hypothetical protein V062_00024 [Staphylococcus aureus R0357]
MNIREATKMSMRLGRDIYRKSQYELRVTLIPSNTHGYIAVVREGSNKSSLTPWWQPTAEDLLAEDWVVLGYEEQD